MQANARKGIKMSLKLAAFGSRMAAQSSGVDAGSPPKTRRQPPTLQSEVYRVISRLMHREELLTQLQANEYDKFAAHLYRSRREYRSACQRAGKGNKQLERCLIATFRVAESLGFNGDVRQWEDLLRIGD